MEKEYLEKDPKYYGMLARYDDAIYKAMDEAIDRPAMHPIFKGDSGKDVVEEIVRRGGDFYDAEQAEPVAPFVMPSPDIFLARYEYREGDDRPKDSFSDGFNWIVVNPAQCMYGAYLITEIICGNLRVEDIVKRDKEVCQ